MNEIVKPVAQWVSQNIPWAVLIGLFIISFFVEISKVKIFPLKWLWKILSYPFKKIDSQRTESFKNLITELNTTMNTKLTEISKESKANCATVKACLEDLEKRFDSLDAQQNETDRRLDELAAARIKNHVLNFARQCRKGEPHSHEDFANLFNENRIYQDLVKKYKWENDVYKHDFEYIKRVYDECNDHGDFLE